MQRLKTWWHDYMMQIHMMQRWKRWTKQITRRNPETWKASEAPVLGRYNTPPLREDLVPRSRMAPEGKRKRKRKVKTKLLLWQTSETMNLERLNQFKEENNKDEQSWKHSVRKGEQGILRKHCRLKDIRKGLQWTRSTCKHSGWNEMYKERLRLEEKW